MFTVVAWSASVDQAALAAIAAVADPHVRINGNDVIVPTEIANLVGAYANGVNITRAQLVSPSLRRLLNPEIAPVDINALPTTPFRFCDVRAVRVSATTTLVAFVWTNGAITFDQSLPAGRYQLVGARFNSAGLIAYRCVIPGYEWRPGGIGVTVDSGAEGNIFRQGNFGVWGEFAHNTPPTIDFLSATADTSETGELDLIKLA